MKKNAFSFLELMLVVVLMISVYSLVATNFSKTKSKTKIDFSLVNIKSYLLDNFDFNEQIKLTCIEDGKRCYVFIDDVVSKTYKISNLFINKPEVYEYSPLLKRLAFGRVEFKNLEEYEVCFEYKINKDKKSDDMIVVSEEKVYVFNSIKEKVLVLDYLNDINDMFEKNIQEVKNAF